ncbi:ABC transporter ATP-binding protein [Paenibacillus flagellatus]|uniref:Spermidine/putrescine ABC transporter ATP-binding protein n=1 Tax=Paenibacillus flagellatus TaxID=2211139 RepID=A0A2V5K8Z4_9BACL|nr:ABC transporter ATP-binding protein [Paenibacillus flagellatus]PYI55989.1 spermidine/putrescine ABC transporter ATP-binding protein [Paenibacillus flagellatus]
MKTAVGIYGASHVYVSGKGAFLAVDRVSFALEAGEFVSLVGPSGCGKTTILSMIAGLIEPTEGRVEVGGSRVRGPSDRIGYMLQHDYLFPWRTILDNALIGLELKGKVTEQQKKSAVRLMEEMGLDGVESKYPHQLSGGMRQRAALVRTLMTSPDILLLDEPFSALDYQTKLLLERLVSDTLRSRGKSALLVTHDISEAIAMSDRVIVLDHSPGRVRKEIVVPEPIRRETPMKARELPDFHALFNGIWKEFEEMESRGETV